MKRRATATGIRIGTATGTAAKSEGRSGGALLMDRGTATEGGAVAIGRGTAAKREGIGIGQRRERLDAITVTGTMREGAETATAIAGTESTGIGAECAAEAAGAAMERAVRGERWRKRVRPGTPSQRAGIETAKRERTPIPMTIATKRGIEIGTDLKRTESGRGAETIVGEQCLIG